MVLLFRRGVTLPEKTFPPPYCYLFSRFKKKNAKLKTLENLFIYIFYCIFHVLNVLFGQSAKIKSREICPFHFRAIKKNETFKNFKTAFNTDIYTSKMAECVLKLTNF